MTTTAPVSSDLGSSLLALARSLFALKASPQAFGLDARVDRAAYISLARLVDEDRMRMSDLASLLCLDLSTVSRQVKALEDLDLVTRTPDPDDRRAYVLQPTAAGRDLVSAVKQKFRQLVDVGLADWSARDRETLAGLLSRLAEDLRPDRAPSLLAAVREHRSAR